MNDVSKTHEELLRLNKEKTKVTSFIQNGPKTSTGKDIQMATESTKVTPHRKSPGDAKCNDTHHLCLPLRPPSP